MANGFVIGPAQETGFGALALVGVDPYDGAQGIVAHDPLPIRAAFVPEAVTEVSIATVPSLVKFGGVDVDFAQGAVNGDKLPIRVAMAVDDAVRISMSDPPPLPVAWMFPWFSSGDAEPTQLPLRQHWSGS